MEASEQGQPEPPADARTRLMQEVADQMDAIEADYGDEFMIGRVITVVEVFKQQGGAVTGVDVRVRAGQFPWVALGLLDWAKKLVEGAAAAAQAEPPESE